MKYKSIVFSGLPGAGKTNLVRELSNIYGWPIYSVGELWRERWRKKYPAGEIPFEEFWRISRTKDLEQVNLDFAQVAVKGGVIGDSRYAIYLRNLPILLVFLTADLETRAQRAFGLEKYKDKPIEEIRQILQQREVDEIAAGRRLYDYDYRDPLHYNLVLNSGALTIEDEIILIKSIMSPEK